MNNVNNVSGIVNDIFSDLGIGSATVKIGTYTAYADPNGNYISGDIPDGEYQVEVSDGGTNYFTHNAGKLIVNQTKDLEGKLSSINFNIIPLTFNMDFFNETCRQYDGNVRVGAGKGKTQRISDENLTTWKVYMNINDATGSGEPITDTMKNYVIDIVENDWRNEFPILLEKGLDITRTNKRFEIGTTPPDFGTPGYNIHQWDDLIISGGHYEYMNEDKIDSSYTKVKTNQPLVIYKEELMQALGPRWDSNLGISILNTYDSVDDYSQLDKDIIKLLYNRPEGNTDPDNNPSDYVVNP